MDRDHPEGGLELVLDTRKLIIFFALLMVVCVGFFLFGFVEGKRQVLKGMVAKVESETPTVQASLSQVSAKPPEPLPEKKESVEPAVRDPLDWYKSVSKGEPSKKTPPDPAVSRPEAAAPAVSGTTSAGTNDSATEPRKMAPVQQESKKSAGSTAAPPAYSVQVGAFRQQKEAEARAAALKSKGYEGVIEPPGPSSEFYLLKVGRFESRSDAAAMQLRLKKDGFTTLIKSK